MKIHLFFLPTLALCLCTACDDGDIYEEKYISADNGGLVVKLTGTLSGIDTWPDEEGYSLVLAGFDGESNYTSVNKVVPATSDSRQTEIIMAGVGAEVTQVELCIINRLRQRVVTFVSADMESVDDTLRMEVGHLDVSMYHAIQQNVFNTTCANCHGNSTQAAGGLFLTEGKSHAALVGVTSGVMPEYQLVNPGNAEESLLHLLLHGEVGSGWRYEHYNEGVTSTWLNIIDSWINHGAGQ